MNSRLQPLGHYVFVRPCATDTYIHGSLILEKGDDWIEAHVNSGVVIAIGPGVQEVSVGDVVAFLGWKAAIFPGLGRLHDRFLRLHEDDIEAVIC